MSRRYIWGPDDEARTEFQDELIAIAGEAYERATEAFTAAGSAGADGVFHLGRGEAYLGFARACQEIATGGKDAREAALPHP